MTTEKMISVFMFYDGWLDTQRSVDPIKHDAPVHWVDKYQHLRWMCRECIDRHIPNGDLRKAAK